MQLTGRLRSIRLHNETQISDSLGYSNVTLLKGIYSYNSNYGSYGSVRIDANVTE